MKQVQRTADAALRSGRSEGFGHATRHGSLAADVIEGVADPRDVALRRAVARHRAARRRRTALPLARRLR